MCDLQDVFARVEKKYLLSTAQHQALERTLTDRGFRIQRFDVPTIQSVYYDTPDFLLTRRSLERPMYKEKLRLRTYGHPTAASMSYVEIKKKFDGVVYKRRVGLPLPEARLALHTGHMPERAGQIGREIDYFGSLYHIRPQVLIAYERDAWLNPNEGGVRITFDTHVRFRADDLDMTHPATGIGLIPADSYLMEVKIPGVWPLWLTELLWEIGAKNIHFSKVGTAYRDYIAPGLAGEKREEVRRCA